MKERRRSEALCRSATPPSLLLLRLAFGGKLTCRSARSSSPPFWRQVNSLFAAVRWQSSPTAVLRFGHFLEKGDSQLSHGTPAASWGWNLLPLLMARVLRSRCASVLCTAALRRVCSEITISTFMTAKNLAWEIAVRWCGVRSWEEKRREEVARNCLFRLFFPSSHSLCQLNSKAWVYIYLFSVGALKTFGMVFLYKRPAGQEICLKFLGKWILLQISDNLKEIESSFFAFLLADCAIFFFSIGQ